MWFRSSLMSPLAAVSGGFQCLLLAGKRCWILWIPFPCSERKNMPYESYAFLYSGKAGNSVDNPTTPTPSPSAVRSTCAPYFEDRRLNEWDSHGKKAVTW